MSFIVWQDALPGLVEPFDAHDALNVARLRPNISGGPSSVILCGPASSSLDMAWHLADCGRFEPWDSVLCSTQWAGRGQMRRKWFSPRGNVYGAWRWPTPSKSWDTLLPLVAGYVLHRFFATKGIDVQIKWPNDLLFQGKKVGGVLIEEKRGVVVVGVGLNLVWSPDDDMLRKETTLTAGNLFPFFEASDFVSLWAELVSWGRFCYTNLFSSSTPADVVSLIDPLLAFLHQDVRIITGDGEYHACLLGLHEDGGLIIERAGDRHVLYSGTVLPLA